MNDLTNASLGPVTTFKEQFGGTLRMNMVLKMRPRRRTRLVRLGEAWHRSIHTGLEKFLRGGLR